MIQEWLSRLASRIKWLVMGAQIMVINQTITASLHRSSMTLNKLETSLDSAPARAKAQPIATQYIKCLLRAMKSQYLRRTWIKCPSRESPLILSHQLEGHHSSQLQRMPMSRSRPMMNLTKDSSNWYRRSNSRPWGVIMSRLCQSTNVVQLFITSAAWIRSQAIRWAQN